MGKEVTCKDYMILIKGYSLKINFRYLDSKYTHINIHISVSVSCPEKNGQQYGSVCNMSPKWGRD